VTVPTNQLMAAECDEDCLWNSRNVLNGTAMDAGGTMYRQRGCKGLGCCVGYLVAK
jgi:hypothetical protein